MNYFDDVDIFEDGWVFLLGGSNSVRDYWVDKKQIDESVLRDWARVYEKRLDYFQKNGIKYVSVFAPEKLSIYPEKTTLKIFDECIPSRQLIDYFRQNSPAAAACIIDLIPYLRQQSKTYKCYHKTDSHWNFYGAFSAYQLIQSVIGEPLYNSATGAPKTEKWSTLDLGGKFDPPLQEKVFFYDASKNFYRSYANELVTFKETTGRVNDPGLHVGSSIEFENPNALSSSRLLIFGDSFSEYRPHLLTGLMAETYKTVRFVWNSGIDFSVVEAFKPDIVLSELAERFIPKTAPNDSFDLSAYVKAKLEIER